MSPQLKLLHRLIAAARDGNDDALCIVREICVEAAKEAPRYDLLAIAECFLHLGIEAERGESARN